VSTKCGDLRGKDFAPAPASLFKKLLSESGVTDSSVLKCLDEYETYERTGGTPSFDGDANYFADRIVE
jgi:hypothetical protein